MWHADTLRVLAGGWGDERARTYIDVRKNRTRYRYPVAIAAAASPALDRWLAQNGPEGGWHPGYDYVDEEARALWMAIRTGPHKQFGWACVDLKSAEVLSPKLGRSRFDFTADRKRVYDDSTNAVLIDLGKEPDLRGLEITMLSAPPDNVLAAALVASKDSSGVIWSNSRDEQIHRLPLPDSARVQMVDWSPDGSLFCAGYVQDGHVGASVFARSADTLSTPPIAVVDIDSHWRLGRLNDEDRPLPPMWLESGGVLGLRVSRAYREDGKGDRSFPWGEGDSVAVYRLRSSPDGNATK